MNATDWIQALATLALVGITWWYARRIREQAEAAADAAEATRRSAEASERLAELTAPEARASRADALAQIRETAEAIESGAKARQGIRTRDDLRDHLGQSGPLLESSNRRRLERLGARVGGEVQNKVWSVLDAADELAEKRREIRARMESEEGVWPADPGAYGQRAQEVTERVTHLRYAVDRALEDLNADGSSEQP